MAVINLRGRGAGGDGTAADDAFEEAVAAAQRAGVLEIPAGVYLTTRPINITSGITIRGEGWSGQGSLNRGSVIASHGSDVFRVMTDDPCYFENFQIAFSGSSGIGIYLDAATTNTDTQIRRVKITGGQFCVGMGSASRFNISDCVLSGASAANVWIRNVNFPDGGDSVLSNNVIDGSPSDSLVLYQSGGGLKMIGNKLNGPALVGFRLQLITGGASTGVLRMVGNSIEGCNTGITCHRGPGETGKFLFAGMCGNEIAGLDRAIHVLDDDPWLGPLNISGANDLIALRPGAAVEIGTGAASGIISGNTIVGSSGAAIVNRGGAIVGENAKVGVT